MYFKFRWGHLCSFVLMLVLTPGLTLAETAFLPNDPKRPVEKISRDLGITPEQFTSCFQTVQPAPQGTRPTMDRVHSNKSALLTCLQKIKPDLTNEKLDEVMDRYRPGGHEAQEPSNWD